MPPSAEERLRSLCSRTRVQRGCDAGIALFSSACYGPGAYEDTRALVSGSRNRIPGPDEENGNAVALYPAPPDGPWPEGFVR